jgi:hypothetical protein
MGVGRRGVHAAKRLQLRRERFGVVSGDRSGESGRESARAHLRERAFREAQKRGEPLAPRHAVPEEKIERRGEHGDDVVGRE